MEYNWRKGGEFAPDFQMLCKKFSLAFFHTYRWYSQKVALNYFFDHNHPYGSLNISALHVLYGIQAFAKFKRSKCTRLHLRELQSQKFTQRCMRSKLPRKVRRSQLVPIGAIAPILPLYTISLGTLYHKILRPPLARYYWTHSYYMVVARKQSLRVFIFTFLNF